MAYEALARKYRPRTFEEVIGQAPIVRTLTNAILEKRIHHAYVFSGVRGVGKTTVARIFAKALNCEKGPTPKPCLECDPCREIAAGRDLDVIEMDAASRTGVDDVRDLIDTTRYAPARDRYKIFIIDEFHMLSKPAFNALLKTLEEPPPRVLFMMATTELQKVLPTVLSRTQQFDFRRVAVGAIADELGKLAEGEGVRAPRACLELLARAADGSVRDGTSLLDQAIAFCGSEIEEADVRALLGLVPEETIEAFLGAAADRDAGALIRLIAAVLNEGHDLRLFHAGVIEGVRRLLVIKAVESPSEILGLAAEDEARLRGLADRFPTQTLLRLFSVIAALEPQLRYSEQPRYVFEAAALRMAAMVDLTPVEDLIARLEGDRPGPGAPSSGRSSPAGASGAAPSRQGRSSAGADPSRRPPRSADSLPPASRTEGGPAAGEAEQELQEGPARGHPGDRSRGSARQRESREPESSADPAAPAPAADVSRMWAMSPEAEGGVRALLDRLRERRPALAALVERAFELRWDGTRIVMTFADGQAFARKSVGQPENLRILRDAASEISGVAVTVEVGRAEGGEPLRARQGSGSGARASSDEVPAFTRPRVEEIPAGDRAGQRDSRAGSRTAAAASKAGTGADGAASGAVQPDRGREASIEDPSGHRPRSATLEEAAEGPAQASRPPDRSLEAGGGEPAGDRRRSATAGAAASNSPREGAPGGQPSGSTSAGAKYQRLMAQASADPVVKSLMARFGGRIVEIKEVP